MRRVGPVVIFVLLAAASAMAQTAPDAAELTRLLNDFLAGASRNDPAAHDRFWADDLIYTRSAGRRVNKAEIMHDVLSTRAPKPDDPKTVYTAEDIRIQQYGNTAIVAFRLVATTEVDGARQVQNLLNSGTFLKRDGKWQVVNWQSTRKARTDEESEAEVASTIAALHKALAEGDSRKLSALTDPGFVWTTPIKQTTREQLGQLKSADIGNTKETISLYGETAVVRGEGHYTMTLVSQGGAWKLVALHTNE